VKLQFLGGVGTVTGSKYLLTSSRSRVLIDCGLFQGLKQLRLRNRAGLPFHPRELDAVVLTHAHLDHSGYVPLLVKNGFRGPVYCTQSTLELCRLLLPDSGHLLEEEAAYLNRHGLSRHHPALPLYTQEDAEASLGRFVTQPWRRRFEVGDLAIELTPVGHLLGAAAVSVDDGRRRIVFSGDLGRPEDPLLFPPQKLSRADYLLVESTYGDRRHPPDDVLESLAAIITRTVARGGSVIVPAFAIGRSQTLLLLIHELRSQGRIARDLPIFLDSPMASDASRIYERRHTDHRLDPSRVAGVLGGVTFINTPDDSRALDRRGAPMVLISASGMATGGRILHHLKVFAPEPRNTILLTGFQAAGTRGAALAAGAEAIRIHGQDIPVRAQVEKLDGLSAHADYAEILEWLRGFQAPPRMTFVVHGEPSASDAMRRHIQDALHWECRVPEHQETVELD
jgi:metallo-beta-lactamase family protein